MRLQDSPFPFSGTVTHSLTHSLTHPLTHSLQDSPFPFSGTVTVRLVNLDRGTSTNVSTTVVDMGPGAGVTKWFCGTEAAPVPAVAKAAKVAMAMGKATAGNTYGKHTNQIPLDRNSCKDLDTP